MGAALCAFQADICQQAQRRGQFRGAFLQIGSSAAHRQDGFAQLCHIGIRLTGGHGQFVAELIYILLGRFEPQRGHGVGDEVGRIG